MFSLRSRIKSGLLNTFCLPTRPAHARINTRVREATVGVSEARAIPAEAPVLYGRRLAEWAITSAIDRGNSVIEGECSPESSAPFWEKMGFIVSQKRRIFGGGLCAESSRKYCDSR